MLLTFFNDKRNIIIYGNSYIRLKSKELFVGLSQNKTVILNQELFQKEGLVCIWRWCSKAIPGYVIFSEMTLMMVGRTKVMPEFEVGLSAC